MDKIDDPVKMAQRARSGVAEAGQGTEQTRENWEVAIDNNVGARLR